MLLVSRPAVVFSHVNFIWQTKAFDEPLTWVSIKIFLNIKKFYLSAFESSIWVIFFFWKLVNNKSLTQVKSNQKYFTAIKEKCIDINKTERRSGLFVRHIGNVIA